MRYINKKRILILSLSIVLIFSQFNMVFADTTSSAGESATFNANGSGGYSSGSSSTNTNASSESSTSGSSGANVQISPETRQNNNSNSALDNYFSNLSLNNFSRIAGTNTFVENITVPRSELYNLLKDNPFNSSGGGIDVNIGTLPSFELSSLDSLYQNALNNIIAGNVFGDMSSNGVRRSNQYSTHVGIINPFGIPSIPSLPNITLDMTEAQKKMLELYQKWLEEFDSMTKNNSNNLNFPIWDSNTLPDRYETIMEWLSGDFLKDYEKEQKEKWEEEWKKEQEKLGDTPGEGNDGGQAPQMPEYKSDVAISDYCTIQHIVEYSIASTTSTAVWSMHATPYTDPFGGNFRWDITVKECSDPIYVGHTISNYRGTPLSTNENLTYTFRKAGTYIIRAKQRMQTITVNALTYNIQEYWILADTGQMLWKRTSNGKMGDPLTDAGRSQDVNTGYFHAVQKESPTNRQSGGALGTVIRQFTHVVTEDMVEGMFPSTGYDLDYGTVRIQ